MKTQDIKNMGHAYLSVLEAMKKKLDPVDKDELKGDHKDRKDKDIDNDGDADASDVYLHNRRKTISKASKGKEVATTESVKEQLDHSHAKQVANSIAKSNKNLKVTSSGSGEHFVHHKDDPEGESGHVSVKAAGGQLHVSHEMGQAHGNKKFNDTSSAVAHGVRVSSGGVSEAWSVSEAKKMSISGKQIKAALASAKAQAKPKDQVSLKKAPFDIPKESVVYEAMSNNIVDRLHNGEDTNRHMGHEGGYRQHKSAAEDARADGNTKAASSHERAAMSHEHAAKNLKAGKHEVALHHSKDAGRHAMLAVKHGGEETDSHEVHKDHSKAYTDFTGFKSESTERSWTVLNRILEKAHAKDSHTKGATEPEKMGSTASKDEMGFVNAHGGLTGTDSGIDGAKAAAYTASVATANIKVAPGRLGDNKAGDKNIIKPGTQVK